MASKKLSILHIEQRDGEWWLHIAIPLPNKRVTLAILTVTVVLVLALNGVDSDIARALIPILATSVP